MSPKSDSELGDPPCDGVSPAVLKSLSGLEFGQILALAAISHSILRTAELMAVEKGADGRAMITAKFFINKYAGGAEPDACCLINTDVEFAGAVKRDEPDPAPSTALLKYYKTLGWPDVAVMCSCEQC